MDVKIYYLVAIVFIAVIITSLIKECRLCVRLPGPELLLPGCGRGQGSESFYILIVLYFVLRIK